MSTWQLAGAVAREGAIGTLSSVGHSVTPAYKPVFIERIATKKSELGRPLSEEEFNQIFFDTNLYCITQEVTRAKTISMGNGAIWMNVMKATNDYDRQVLAACEAGVDGIVS